MSNFYLAKIFITMITLCRSFGFLNGSLVSLGSKMKVQKVNMINGTRKLLLETGELQRW